MTFKVKESEKNMPDFNIVEYTDKQYKSDMRRLLKEKGLKNAVKEYCDKINEEVSGTRYITHRSVQEYLCDILFLVEESEGRAIEIQNILTQLHKEYRDTENGAAGEDVRWWNAGIRRAIEIVERSDKE